jgi:hypothetical protein
MARRNVKISHLMAEFHPHKFSWDTEGGNRSAKNSSKPKPAYLPKLYANPSHGTKGNPSDIPDPFSIG